MKKKTIGNKFGIIVVTLALSMAMLAGCGNTSDRNADEVSTEEAADPAGMVHLESAEDVHRRRNRLRGGNSHPRACRKGEKGHCFRSGQKLTARARAHACGLR